MIQKHSLLLVALISLLGFSQVPAQLASNPKLSPKDLETARTLTSGVGGSGAELVYAARLDVIQKGSFDTLIIVYAKPAKRGPEFYAFVAQEDKNYPLISEKQGLALKAGDKFLRIGLKHEEGKAPLLRLMASANVPGKGEMQRNLDFQFNGTEFAMIGETMMPIPKQL